MEGDAGWREQLLSSIQWYTLTLTNPPTTLQIKDIKENAWVFMDFFVAQTGKPVIIEIESD